MSVKASNYNYSASGARSNVLTKSSQAPSIKYVTTEGKSVSVRFDGVDGNILIDRKIAVVTTDKAKSQALRQPEALKHNGLVGR